MCRLPNRGPGFRIDRLDTHGAHESLASLPVDPETAGGQFIRNTPTTVKRQFQVNLIYLPHEFNIVIGGRMWPIVIS